MPSIAPLSPISPPRPAPRLEADASAAAPAAPLQQLAPNPSLRVEAALNLVVLEFRDAAGEVQRSIPTEREIDAYRAALRRGDRAQQAPQNGPEPIGEKPAKAIGSPEASPIPIAEPKSISAPSVKALTPDSVGPGRTP